MKSSRSFKCFPPPRLAQIAQLGRLHFYWGARIAFYCLKASSNIRRGATIFSTGEPHSFSTIKAIEGRFHEPHFSFIHLNESNISNQRDILRFVILSYLSGFNSATA